MRVVMVGFALACVACSAFAWSELRQLRAHEAARVSQTEPDRELLPAIDHKPEVEKPAPPPASTWRGPLPFGGVPSAEPPSDESDLPGATNDVVTDGPVTGEFADDEEDGRTVEATPARIIIDGDGRHITLERSEIIIF